MKYEFETSCVEANGDDITEMVEKARGISYRTFAKYVDCRDVNARLGYEPHRRMCNGRRLTVNTDFHTSFHKSTYRGMPCCYVRWSAIEFVYVRHERGSRQTRVGE